MEQISPKDLNDHDLIARTKRAAENERRTTAELVALLAEMDDRRLYEGEGCSSLFAYCTQVLHLSEHAAYGRIEAARLSRRFPVVLRLLDTGEATLTTVCLLATHLTDDNCDALFSAIRHKSKREVEHLVAAIAPCPDIAPLIRKVLRPVVDHSLGASHPRSVLAAVPADSLSSPAIASARPTIAPLAPERYLIKVTVGAETHAKLRRAQDLLRHAVPDGDPAAIIDRGLTLLVAQLERAKLGLTPRPEPRPTAASPATSSSRHVSAAIRREVWTRDEGRCAFVGAEGRCSSTAFLEIHHVFPFAAGGKTVTENLSLRCRAHNGFEAEKFFGERATRWRREKGQRTNGDGLEFFARDSAG
jgi:hypothetical protein